MKAIKFRCWFAGRMWYGIPKITFMEGGVRQVDLNHDHDDFCADADTWTGYGDYVLMQFTGLHDRNGVEVYEGDILRLPAQNEWEKNNFSAFEVFWHDNDAAPTDVGLCLGRMKNFGSVAGGYSGYKLIPRDVGRMQVIGNIFEHPELVDREAV